MPEPLKDLGMPPLRIFIGYDKRQPLAYTVLQHSIARHSSRPVAITPLMIDQLPMKRRGLTDFTFLRFMVPWLCGYVGKAVFMDADMVVTGDIAELFAVDNLDPVSVMKAQQRFEWGSMMLFNCSQCEVLTPEYIADEKNNPLDLSWASSIGDLPAEWNHCVGYADPKEAKLYHFTQGLPCWPETRGLPEDAVWTSEHQAANATVSWKELMGKSVHAQHVLERLLERLTS